MKSICVFPYGSVYAGGFLIGELDIFKYLD